MGGSRRPGRVVAIGDLNGAVDVLRGLLRDVELIDGNDRWTGGRAHLIQVGDIFNRGGGAREAFELLGRLAVEAAEQGGRVTVLLGNHEVMTALGIEAYCTADEYLAFATEAQRREWRLRVAAEFERLYRDHPPGGPVLPVGPRLEAWKIRHVPGQDALRRALGPRGALGRVLRALPIAVVDGGCVFCHAGLTPAWARRGLDGLNQTAREQWQAAPEFYRDLPRNSILSASNGPLWNRSLALRDTAHSRRQLERSLDYLGAQRMVIGHTPTIILPDGVPGRIGLRHDGKLVCIDVALGRNSPLSRAALVIENGRGVEVTPEGDRELWNDRPRATRRETRRAARRVRRVSART